MNLDPKTLILFNSISSLFIGLGLYTISHGYLGQIWEIRRWALTVLMQGAGWIFLGTIGEANSDYASIILGYGLILFSLSMSFNILASFLKVKIRHYLAYFLFAIGLSLIGYYTFVFPDILKRIAFLALSSSILFISSGFILLKNKKWKLRSHFFTAFIYAICGMFLGSGSIYVLFWDKPYIQSIFERDNALGISYTIFFLGVVLIPFAFLLMCIDIFILKKEMSDERIKKLTMGIEQSPNSVMITDTDGAIEYVNPSFSEITGYLPEEVIGKNPRILKSGYTSLKEYKEIWNTICSGQRWKGIFRNKKKNGELYWESTSISPLKNQSGEISHFIAIKENITAQIIAERKLAESEEKHRLIMQTSTDLIHITDIRGNLLDYNSAFLRHLGYNEEEAETLKVKDWDVQWNESELEKIIEDLIHKPQMFETMHRRKDGTVRNVEINAIGIMIQGEYYLYASGRDITERKQNEFALKESEEKFKSFFQMNKAIFLLIDPMNGKILDANSAAQNYYGYSVDDLKSMRVTDINTLSAEEIKAEMQNASLFMRNYFNFKHRLKNSDIRDVEVYSTPITINQKNILFSMVHDVTERKEAERLLLESETRLKLALEGAKEGTWDWNIKTGKVIFDNYWAEMLGYELSDISPNVTSWEELLHPEDREIVFDCLRKHLNGDTEVYQMEHRMKTKSGKWKWILGHGKVIERNEIGEALRAIGTHVDIDIYKVAHEELRIVSEELKNSNATKDKFFSIISHDLRGPIGNINSLLELITNTESKLSEEEYSEFMGIVKSSTKNAYILLENLLVWSRSQKGQIEFNPFKYNIHDLIKANINLFIISAKNKKISITSSVDKNVFAYFDFDMMNTVIRNLIGNAIKYTNQNGKILISTREESEFTEIIIQDNGIGMSEAIVQSLFRIDLKQPSIQGTNGEKGSRLGLILCKEFLDKHKGYIGVKSEPNKGTEFVVRLYSPTVK